MQPDVEIHNDHEYQEAVRALAARTRPGWLLRLLMNALERYRQARKMGWSRPQNKHGLMVFASYELSPHEDVDILDAAFTAATTQFGAAITREDGFFLQSLRDDPALMGFLFVHDLVEGERRFEGMTYSFGRRAQGAPRCRDRVDLIVESEVSSEAKGSITRMRLYIDPFVYPLAANPARVFTEESHLTGATHALFERASLIHKLWSARPEKHWSHWTADYIDYFGPRTAPVSRTSFPTHVDVINTFRRQAI